MSLFVGDELPSLGRCFRQFFRDSLLTRRRRLVVGHLMLLGGCMKRHPLFVAVLTALSPLALFSLTFSPLAWSADLAQALEAAEQHDPAWAAVRNSLQGQQEVVALGRAGVLPTLVLQSSHVISEGESKANPPFVPNDRSYDYSTTQHVAKLTQPLFSPEHWYGYSQARASGQAVDMKYQEEEENFLLRVSETYLGVLRAHDAVALGKAQEGALGRQLEQAQERFKVGLVAITEVHEAQAAYDSARADRMSAESKLVDAREVLAAETGGKVWDAVPVAADFPITMAEPAEMKAWEELTRGHNAEYRYALKSSDAAEAAVKGSKGKRLPSVDAYVQYHESSQSGDGAFQGPSSGTDLGVQVQWALFAGGATTATVRQSSAKAAAARDEVRVALLKALRATHVNYYNVQTDVQRVGARKQAVVSSESAAAATQAGYEVGTRNIVDVLMAQRALYGAKLEYSNARYDYILNVLKLKQSAGVLKRDDLLVVNQWVRPEPAKP